MEEIKLAYKNLYQVIDTIRLTGPERRQLEHDLWLLYEKALDENEEKVNPHVGTD